MIKNNKNAVYMLKGTAHIPARFWNYAFVSPDCVEDARDNGWIAPPDLSLQGSIALKDCWDAEGCTGPF